MVIPEDPLLGCECAGGCDSGVAAGCCPSTNDAVFPYSKFGRLRLEVGMPVFECNKRCACNPEQCFNRVVQKGRKVRDVALFSILKVIIAVSLVLLNMNCKCVKTNCR